MAMVHKNITIRIDQELWVEKNMKDGEFSELMRNKLDQHIKECAE